MLPITEMLEEQINHLDKYDFEESSETYLKRFLPQVRTLEEAQQKKAKEEERERIVGILGEIRLNSLKQGRKFYDVEIERNILQEAIERISNNQ